jgi:hypothetical protein
MMARIDGLLDEERLPRRRRHATCSFWPVSKTLAAHLGGAQCAAAIKAAEFPAVKGLDSFDFAALP